MLGLAQSHARLLYVCEHEGLPGPAAETHYHLNNHSPLNPQVRDYAFDPDSGAISTLKFDVLGLPSIPQALLPCSALRWEEVVAVAPQRIVVRR